MKRFAWAVKYLAAFVSGYVGALIPILIAGDLPGRRALIAALGAGLIATGLFRSQPPQVCAKR